MADFKICFPKILELSLDYINLCDRGGKRLLTKTLLLRALALIGEELQSECSAGTLIRYYLSL